MRATGAFVLAACGAVLFCALTAVPRQQLFAAPPLPVTPRPVYGAALAAAPGSMATPAPAFQVTPTASQPNAFPAFFAGAALVAAVCSRGRVAAAVDGAEPSAAALSRRAMLAGLAASPLLATSSPANADWAAQTGLGRENSKPQKKKKKVLAAWAPRKNQNAIPQSVKNKCNVEKPCNKGAVFPLSDRANKWSEKQLADATAKFKSRQPPEPAQ